MTVLRNALLEREDLPEVTKLSLRTIEEEIRQGRFPKPRQMSGRRAAWLARDVDEWMENLPESDLPPPPNTGAKKPRDRAAPPAAPASHPAG
jgi:prophage regulatory protein